MGTGSGLVHGVCGDPANFIISTKGAGAGGLSLAVEGPSKAEINCQDNKDGTVNVSYLPTAPGEYKIYAKFADQHIDGSPFTCKVTGEGTKRQRPTTNNDQRQTTTNDKQKPMTNNDQRQTTTNSNQRPTTNNDQQQTTANDKQQP